MSRVIKSQTVYEGKVIKVYREYITQGDGEALREVVRHSGGACVLAEKNGEFAFVRQYRHAMDKDMLEIPAGKLENGEAFNITAARELEEECALKPLNLTKIAEVCVSPGYDDEVIGIFFASEFSPSVQKLDDDEELTVEWIKKEQAYAMVRSGEITDAKTVIALLWRENQELNRGQFSNG